MQNCNMASPFVTWAKGLSTQTVGEDLFFCFFGLHLILGRKTDLVLGRKIFILIFIIFKFSVFPDARLKNFVYATEDQPSGSFG